MSTLSIADRVKALRKGAKLSQEEMAERLYISRDYLSQIENGREPSPRLKQQIELLDQVGLSPAPTADRVGKKELAARESGQAYYGGGRKVPIISWASAGELVVFEEVPKEWQRTLFTECSDPEAFAVEVEGDSMTPDFRPGDIVVVMPSQKPRNHSVVLAKLKTDGVVLKVLNLVGRDGRTFRLSSLNPVYQPTDYSESDFHWIYPVHSSRRLHWR